MGRAVGDKDFALPRKQGKTGAEGRWGERLIKSGWRFQRGLVCSSGYLMDYRPSISQRDYPHLRPSALRRDFVLGDLFRRGKVTLHHWETDRTVLGGAVPAEKTLELPLPAGLRATHFCERRELGIINLGGAGSVTVDGRKYVLGHLDVLYVGRGARRVSFASASAKKPARLYLVSYPAHARYPTKYRSFADMKPRELGVSATENYRLVRQVISPAGIRSCQLVMSFTLVQPGSKWNTMPPHTHLRRSEVYCYFGFPRGGAVKHFAGDPRHIRTFRLGEGEAVLSPAWSVHSGEGTGHYGFVWAMGGENQEWADMDSVDPKVIYRAR